MTVSVVIPVHNGELYLGETLRSVLANTRPAQEILVVDDGSTDATQDVARAFPTVRYLRQEKSGAATARHRGALRSSGELIALLDADDLWEPEKLAVQVAYLERNPDVHGVFCAVAQFISSDLTAEEGAVLSVDTRPQVAWIPSGFVVRRTAYDAGPPFSQDYQVGEFIDWCLRAQDAGCRFEAVPDVLIRRRIHRSNLGRQARNSRQDYARIVRAALLRRRAAPPKA